MTPRTTSIWAMAKPGGPPARSNREASDLSKEIPPERQPRLVNGQDALIEALNGREGRLITEKQLDEI